MRRDDQLTQQVMSYFNNPLDPLAPSQIDMVMGLPEGTARKAISELWREQKERAALMKSTDDWEVR